MSSPQPSCAWQSRITEKHQHNKHASFPFEIINFYSNETIKSIVICNVSVEDAQCCAHVKRQKINLQKKKFSSCRTWHDSGTSSHTLSKVYALNMYGVRYTCFRCFKLAKMRLRMHSTA